MIYIFFKLQQSQLRLNFIYKTIICLFDITIFMPPVFKEIYQTKAVDMQILIGNVGGYLGLFLGKFNRVRSNWDYRRYLYN